MSFRVRHKPPEPVDNTPRGTVTPRMKVEVTDRQGGKCYLCDQLLVGRVEYDHEIPLAQGGADSIDNLRALHPECHADKTKFDNWATAKAKRQGGQKGQYARRKKNGSKLIHPKLKKKVSGEVVKR